MSILTKEEAEAVYIAMCQLNTVCGLLHIQAHTRLLQQGGMTKHVQEYLTDEIEVSLGDRPGQPVGHIERYANQAEFAKAYGLKPAEPFVVKHYVGEDSPSIKGNGFDGTRVSDDREGAEELVAFVNKRIGVKQRGVVGVVLVILFAIFSIVFLALLIRRGAENEARWQQFKVDHQCKLVEYIDWQTSTGVGVGADGKVGTVIVTTPAKYGFKCDDGVTYWR